MDTDEKIPDINVKKTTSEQVKNVYKPVATHWFYKETKDEKFYWVPFSTIDSQSLDEACTLDKADQIVSTDGGRYDVYLKKKERVCVYWESTPCEVRRCSWFRKSKDTSLYIPYDEDIANILESAYKQAYEMNAWHQNVDLPNNERVTFHSSDVLVLNMKATVASDGWGSTQPPEKPRLVKRGIDNFNIEPGETAKIDHLLFLVHGIGSFCDLKFRKVEEVVDEFRSTTFQLVQSHYRSSCEQGLINRIEVLPISWHSHLHSEETGIDKTLKSITLDSIPRLREFTNDTVLDVLFYTSPVYSQKIISTVTTQMNRVYKLFKMRNSDFNGTVSLGGHSLGSLILFDLLLHQIHVEHESSPTGTTTTKNLIDSSGSSKDLNENDKSMTEMNQNSYGYSFVSDIFGTGQLDNLYPHLDFHPVAFFALGSPIGMFITVRGCQLLGENFALPTCPAFFNIFHPYDPVAYRIESLINPDYCDKRPVLIPHHKGRKRLHLELKETVERYGAELKQKVVDSMKTTWNSFYQLALLNRPDTSYPKSETVENLAACSDDRLSDDDTETMSLNDSVPASIGLLNQGRRIDYVLQEAPLEFFNEYIFALSSHVCYWESQDTMLFIIKEIYSTTMNVLPDSKIPQQTMSIQRPVSM